MLCVVPATVPRYGTSMSGCSVGAMCLDVAATVYRMSTHWLAATRVTISVVTYRRASQDDTWLSSHTLRYGMVLYWLLRLITRGTKPMTPPSLPPTHSSLRGSSAGCCPHGLHLQHAPPRIPAAPAAGRLVSPGGQHNFTVSIRSAHSLTSQQLPLTPLPSAAPAAQLC